MKSTADGKSGKCGMESRHIIKWLSVALALVTVSICSPSLHFPASQPSTDQSFRFMVTIFLFDL